jgi:hypothetical protein
MLPVMCLWPGHRQGLERLRTTFTLCHQPTRAHDEIVPFSSLPTSDGEPAAPTESQGEYGRCGSTLLLWSSAMSSEHSARIGASRRRTTTQARGQAQ